MRAHGFGLQLDPATQRASETGQPLEKRWGVEVSCTNGPLASASDEHPSPSGRGAGGEGGRLQLDPATQRASDATGRPLKKRWE